MFQIVAISMLIFNLPFGIEVMWAAMILTVWSAWTISSRERSSSRLNTLPPFPPNTLTPALPSI